MLEVMAGIVSAWGSLEAEKRRQALNRERAEFAKALPPDAAAEFLALCRQMDKEQEEHELRLREIRAAERQADAVERISRRETWWHRPWWTY